MQLVLCVMSASGKNRNQSVISSKQTATTKDRRGERGKGTREDGNEKGQEGLCAFAHEFNSSRLAARSSHLLCISNFFCSVFVVLCLCVLKEEVGNRERRRTIRKLAKQLTSLLALVDVLHVDGHIEVQREIVGSWKQRQQVSGGGTQQREGQRHYS